MLYVVENGVLIGYILDLPDDKRAEFKQRESEFLKMRPIDPVQESSERLAKRRASKKYLHANAHELVKNVDYFMSLYKVEVWENPISSSVYSIFMGINFTAENNASCPHTEYGLPLNFDNYFTEEKMEKFDKIMKSDLDKSLKRDVVEAMFPEFIRLIEIFSAVRPIRMVQACMKDRKFEFSGMDPDAYKEYERVCRSRSDNKFHSGMVTQNDLTHNLIAANYDKFYAIAKDNTWILNFLKKDEYKKVFGDESKDKTKQIEPKE